MTTAKAPVESEVRSTHIIMPEYCTTEGILRAGVLLEWVDYAAGMTCIRHTRQIALTRFMDSLTFHRPIRAGNAIHLCSRLTWVGRSSMEVTVDIQREDLRSGEQEWTNTARLVFVAVSPDLHPVPGVTALRFENAAEQDAFAAGEERARRRRETPREAFDFTPQVVRTEQVMPGDQNPHGALSGGKLMAWMDFAANLAALRHVRAPLATKAVDDLNFDLPIRLGDAVHVHAAVTSTGHTSCEVAVRVLRETLFTGETVRSHTAYWTFVGIDADLRPTPIRPYTPATPETAQHAVAEARHRRRRGLPAQAQDPASLTG